MNDCDIIHLITSLNNYREVVHLKLLVKYDIRGIQKFIFRTKKLKEIRAVQNIPEKIIFESFKNAANAVLNLNNENMSESECLDILSAKGIQILDKAGGNAYVLFDCDNAKHIYEKISQEMAFYILKKTYSLELVYACVECTENFFADYEKLNAKLGKLKSQMPSAYHIGAFPICRSDKDTYLPIIAKDKYNNDVTMESALKSQFNSSLSKSQDENMIDNYILEKGVDSHIAIIHIDGNNMGARINKILQTADYSNAKKTFSSIKVRDRFAKVCEKMNELTDEYTKVLSKDSKKDPKDIHLVHAIIQAGDDITYITRADIALSFTKKFIELISEEYMIDNTHETDYLISACAGISYIDSHFPFSDGYDLAEACCSNAKARAKKNKSSDQYKYIGNWIDFEICRHIKNVNLSQSRKLYGTVNNTILYKKPYCIKHPNYQNEFFDFDSFEHKIQNLLSDKPILNRSRAKELREAYSAGSEYVETLAKSAISRNYLSSENGKPTEPLYDEYEYECEGKRKKVKYASYYDAIDIMDLYSDFNAKEES